MIFPGHPTVDERAFHGIAFLLLFLAGVCSAHAADKKFIEFGWDMPDTRFLREHSREMEREGPFDGVIFRVEA